YRPARPLRGATAVQHADFAARPRFGASAFRSYFSKPGLRITSKLVEIPQNPPSSRLYRFPETTNNLEVGEHRSRSSASPAPSQRRPYPGSCRGSRKRFPRPRYPAHARPRRSGVEAEPELPVLGVGVGLFGGRIRHLVFGE